MFNRPEARIISIEAPILLPRPKKLQLGSGTVRVDLGWLENLVPAGDGDLLPFSEPDVIPYNGISLRPIVGERNPEGYTLRIIPAEPPDEPVIIEATSWTGLTNGLRTLRQLWFQYGWRMPLLVIEDEPSFPMRGVMLDVSRDRVPTMKTLYELIGLLASWKINHLQLYTEHTFAYHGHETVWKDASPFFAQEIQELNALCFDRGITLAANQNCFGHLNRWLRHPAYAHLAETTGEWLFMGQPRRGPFSLCPIDPRSADFVDDLLEQLLPCFTSRLVNIDCDETFDVGQGRSREAVVERGYAAVYAEFVSMVAESARRRGFRPMFWADIALNHPEALPLLPKDLLALAWGYEPDSPFDRWCELLGENGFEFWVCPGTSSWRSITGRTTERRDNLHAAAEAGVKYRARGFMVTDWGDLGHRQQFPISLYALAEAADAAWNADNAGHFDPRAFGANFRNDREEWMSVGLWLDKLGDADRELRLICGRPDAGGNPTPLRNASALFTDLHTPFDSPARPGSIADWEKVRKRLKELEDSFPSLGAPIYRDELRHSLNVAQFALERAMLRRGETPPIAEKVQKLQEWRRGIIAEHRRLWRLRSRPGGLDDSCGYYIQY